MADITPDWLADTTIDNTNLDEECIRQAGLFGYWAHQEVQCIINEDSAVIEMNKAEDNLNMAKARANANMRGMDLARLNKLLNTELPKAPDVALWKELTILHPDVIAAKAKYVVAQKAFLNVKHARLDRKNARRSMEAKAQEINNLIYLQNKQWATKDSYTMQPKLVKATRSDAIRGKAAEAMAMALKKKITARVKA